MRNLIKEFADRIAEDNIRRINDRIDADMARAVYVANDPNDPEDNVYVYVRGIPIMCVSNNNDIDTNTLAIDNVGDFIGHIKKMYRNQLDRETC